MDVVFTFITFIAYSRRAEVVVLQQQRSHLGGRVSVAHTRTAASGGSEVCAALVADSPQVLLTSSLT